MSNFVEDRKPSSLYDAAHTVLRAFDLYAGPRKHDVMRQFDSGTARVRFISKYSAYVKYAAGNKPSRRPRGNPNPLFILMAMYYMSRCDLYHHGQRFSYAWWHGDEKIIVTIEVGKKFTLTRT